MRGSEKYELTSSGIVFHEPLTEKEYRGLLRVAGSTVTVGPWLVGDAVEYGESRWGNKYEQWIDETGLSPERLRVCAWVARRYSHARRNPRLSFEVHRELAYIQDDLDQDKILCQAAEEGWNSKDVREWKRNERGESNNHTPLWRITLQIPDEWGDNFDGEEFIESCEEFFREWDFIKPKHSRPDGY